MESHPVLYALPPNKWPFSVQRDSKPFMAFQFLSENIHSHLGWFFVSSVDEQGWVPCSYLEPVDGKSEENAVTKCLTGKYNYKRIF